MSKRRVVITGLGSINPLGLNVEASWRSLIEGRSGVRSIEYFDTRRFSCKIAASVPNFELSDFINPKDIRKMDKFISYGMIAAQEAIKDSGWVAQNEEDADMTGVVVGSGIGGLGTIESTSINLFQSEQGKVSPFFIPSSLANLLPGHIAIKYGFTGPNISITTACASGTHAIGEGFKYIAHGISNIVIAGGSEAPINSIGVAGFVSLQALSCTHNDSPTLASRPWDRARDGFVIGEGAGVLVLEEYEHAKRRNAKIYAEIIGYGLTGDAHHITAPSGMGAKKSMLNAIKDAGIEPSMIDYINAHGTSTPIGDLVELDQVQDIFRDNKKIAMSSNKSSIGHLLGAAGAVEAIFTIYALKKNILPPTLNLDNPEPNIKINLVPFHAQEQEIFYAMSNSFGFGGTNASIILKKL